MNKVNITAEDIPLPGWSGKICTFALKVLEKINRNNWELSILLCGEKTITQLNSKYREKPEPTDILSFNLGETIQENGKTVFFPGDIVISLDNMRENAGYFKIPEDEELRRLIIHGILHLDGMEHETNDKDEAMLRLQEEILNSLKNEQILPEGKIEDSFSA